MEPKVKDVAHELTTDIDPDGRYDVRELDTIVFTCITAAKDALSSSVPCGYSEFERDVILGVLEGLRQSHLSIRTLVGGTQGAWAVDALTVARLQVETLFSLCYLLQGPDGVRSLLKNAWKRKYIRFLLQKRETKNFSRYDDFNNNLGPLGLEKLRLASFVTDEERNTVDLDELGNGSASSARTPITPFPTPLKVIKQLADGSQRNMLKRLYIEYQYLCSFAHGDFIASQLRTMADTRSPTRHFLEGHKISDVYQREILEPPLAYSTLSSLQAATEVLVFYRDNVELTVKVSNGWTAVLKIFQLASPLWEIRSRSVVPLIGARR